MNSVKRGTINLDIPRFDRKNGQNPEKTVPWKLNQILKATVISTAQQGKMLQVEGKNYNIQTDSHAEPGKSMLLKVVSISPRIELAFIESFRNSARVETNPSAVLSSELLQKTLLASKKNISTLLNYIKLLGPTGLQTLPTETRTLLDSLKKKLLRSGDLSNTQKLKPALRQSGLLLESKLVSLDGRQQLTTPAIESDLKAMLVQIFKTLGHRQAPTSTAKTPANIAPGYGLSAYKDNDLKSSNSERQLKQQLEDVLAKIVSQQNKTLEQSNEERQRWFFELPVIFRSHAQSIPITIYRDGSSKNETTSEPVWGAEFSIELEHHGIINADVNVVSTSVSISLLSEQRQTAQFLDKYFNRLHEDLGGYGLSLNTFDSQHIDLGQL